MITLEIKIQEPRDEFCNDCYLLYPLDGGESLPYCRLFCCHLKEIPNKNNILRCKKCLNAEKFP